MKNPELLQQFAPKAPKSVRNGNNAVIYTRVSSSDQEDNTSLGSQKKHCEQFAERRGLNIVGYFGGTYESAKTDDRKEFNKMLQFVKRSKNINYVIVYSYERFSRSGINGASIADELLKKYGIVTLAVTQELDPTTPAGSFQQKILFLFGQMDNELRRDKVVTGMQEMLLKGYWVWEVPRGYTNLNKGAKATERKIVVNDEGKILKKAFEWKAYKQMSNVEISRKLKKLGVNMPDKRLNNLFLNPFYCGYITSSLIPEKIIKGHHEALVSPELFLMVHGVRQENRTQGYVKDHENENLPLKVFTKCNNCNESMTGYLVKKKGLYYYKCSTKGCCNNRSAKYLHNLFKSILDGFKIDKEEVEIIKVQLEEQFSNFFEENIEEKKTLENNRRELKRKIEAIEERFVIGEIDKSLYEKFRSKYDKELIDLETEISKTSISISNLQKVINYALDICSKPQLIWEKLDLHGKRILQNMIFPDGIRYDRQNDQYRTFRLNSFFALIPELAGLLMGNKKGDSIIFDKIPLVVVPPGLEPGTT